jgi:hypothetical protein
LPWVIGLLVQVAGLGYVIHSCVLVLLPGTPELVNAAFLVPAFVGELSLASWLLVKGVDAAKLDARVRSSTPSVWW